MNAPSDCVTVAIFSPVARLSSVTVAPGSTAPLVSRATPTMRPRVVCAAAGHAADAAISNANSSRREARALMDPPDDDHRAPVTPGGGRGVRQPEKARVGLAQGRSAVHPR